MADQRVIHDRLAISSVGVCCDCVYCCLRFQCQFLHRLHIGYLVHPPAFQILTTLRSIVTIQMSNNHTHHGWGWGTHAQCHCHTQCSSSFDLLTVRLLGGTCMLSSRSSSILPSSARRRARARAPSTIARAPCTEARALLSRRARGGGDGFSPAGGEGTRFVGAVCEAVVSPSRTNGDDDGDPDCDVWSRPTSVVSSLRAHGSGPADFGLGAHAANRLRLRVVMSADSVSSMWLELELSIEDGVRSEVCSLRLALRPALGLRPLGLATGLATGVTSCWSAPWRGTGQSTAGTTSGWSSCSKVRLPIRSTPSRRIGRRGVNMVAAGPENVVEGAETSTQNVPTGE